MSIYGIWYGKNTIDYKQLMNKFVIPANRRPLPIGSLLLATLLPGELACHKWS